MSHRTSSIFGCPKNSLVWKERKLLNTLPLFLACKKNASKFGPQSNTNTTLIHACKHKHFYACYVFSLTFSLSQYLGILSYLSITKWFFLQHNPPLLNILYQQTREPIYSILFHLSAIPYFLFIAFQAKNLSLYHFLHRFLSLLFQPLLTMFNDYTFFHLSLNPSFLSPSFSFSLALT